MKSFSKKNKQSRRLKDMLLRSFLGVSIIFSVFLVSNCDDLFNHIPIFPGHGGDTSNPPEFGGSESGSYVTTLFKSVAEGAAGEIGGSTISWAMSRAITKRPKSAILSPPGFIPSAVSFI